MRVLVLGAKGQLGTEICAVYADADLVAADIDTIDIRDKEGVRALLERTLPDLVINTTAAHNVPRCEEEPGVAFAVNAIAVRDLAAACRVRDARLVHISTDYVFGDGTGQPYTEEDRPAPMNVYGASKLAGEHLLAAEWDNHIILRTAALYGPAPCVAKQGMNFVRLMLHLAETRDEIKVVTDEITTPTYTKALARQIRLVAEKGEPGLYHATCGGACSWYEFAEAIFAIAGKPVRLVPAKAADFASNVRRPHYSVLENKRLQEQGLDIMPHWRETLKAYLEGLGN